MSLRKTIKLLRNPTLFLRDYLLKRHPLILNEVGCPLSEEQTLIRSGFDLHAQIDNQLAVDVVITWVDDTDPAWRARLQTAQANGQESVGKYALDAARFANHDELRFSLQSIRMFLPWVNKIYVVTDRQRPAWWKDEPNIQIVDHTEIIPHEYLPTFNSHVIEACLHRIPGLSDHFVYFNDDVFVARSLPKSHFFRSNGIASLFSSRKSIRAMRAKGVATPTLGAAARGADLLKAQYGVVVDTPLVHTYVPLQKKMFELVWARHDVQIRSFMGNRFRGAEDLNLATFLVPWTAYLEGASVPAIDICYYFNSQSPAARTYWQQLSSQKHKAGPHSFCANDFNDQHKGCSEAALPRMLNNYFNAK